MGTAEIGPPDQVASFLANKEYYSNSSLDLFQSCRRRFMYTKQWHLDSGRWSASADAGTVLHHGLAILHASGGDINQMLDAATEKWNKLFDDRGEVETAYTLPNLLDILLGYVKHWRHFPYQVSPDMIEVAGVCKIQDFYYVCRIDLLPHKSQFGDKYAVVDIKSSSSFRDFARRFSPDRQFTGNVFVARSILGSERVSIHPIVDGLLVNTSQREYCRQELHRTEADLAEWERETCEWVYQIRSARDRNIWPQSTKSCNNYGRCPFDELCITHINPSLLNMFSRSEQRDPLHLGD